MELVWDKIGDRTYETGVDHGVLYLPDNTGAYVDGVAWNGLTSVSESPSGAEANPQYADNIKYLNLISAEQFAATIEALTYPPEFEQFDGLAVPVPGLSIGQQSRRGFGLCYRTIFGNDLEGGDFGYKLHLVYGATASPSEKQYSTINDSPEAIAFSWELATIPVPVPGMKPTSLVVVDSTKVDADSLAALETILYGAPGTDPRLPLPAEVITLFSGAVTTVPLLAAPAYNGATHTITIPATTGVDYYANGELVAAGPLVITEDTVVEARTQPGYEFTPNTDTDWGYDYS